jgi:hypothetical protein
MLLGGAVSTVVDNVGADVLSVVIGAACTAAVTVGRWALVRFLPARRTWRFTSGRDLRIVVSSSAMVHTGLYQRPVTGIGQVRALSLLSPLLRRAYRDANLSEVLLSEELAGHDLNNNLLVIGGPKTNWLARDLLERLAPRLPFTVTGTVITWGPSDYDGEAEGDNVLHDFGYVVRAVHPLHPERRVVIVAGSHTFGTAAAAQWLARHGGSRKLPAELAVLIEADVSRNDHIGMPKVLFQLALTPA